MDSKVKDSLPPPLDVSISCSLSQCDEQLPPKGLAHMKQVQKMTPPGSSDHPCTCTFTTPGNCFNVETTEDGVERWMGDCGAVQHSAHI